MAEKKNISEIESTNEVVLSKESSKQITEVPDSIDASGDVSDLMGELGNEKISEVAREQKDSKHAVRKDNKKGKVSKKVKAPPRPLPSHNVRRRKVIDKLEKEEKKLRGSLKEVRSKPYQFAERVKEIRSLRRQIQSFLKASLDVIKNMYLKYFGSRHGVKNQDK